MSFENGANLQITVPISSFRVRDQMSLRIAEVDATAVPGGRSNASGDFEGPSGVLICCEDHIIWRDMDSAQHRVPIPRRKHPLADPNRGLIIVASVMHKMRVCRP